MNRFKVLFLTLILSYVSFSQVNSHIQPQFIAASEHPNQSERFSVVQFTSDARTNACFQYQKLELGVSLPQSIENRIVSFFEMQNDPDPINPFRYEDIAIYAVFRDAHGSIFQRDAFYYKEFIRNLAQNKWQEDTTTFPFRIRFSPPMATDYQATVFIKIGLSLIDSASFQFHVKESNNPGFLEKGVNGKHFRFSKNKTSFIGVGQDIPWPVWEDWSRLDKAIGPRNVQAMYRSMKNLHEAKGNFTRFVAATWFMQLEYEALGNYAPRLGQAWEFDRMVEYCEDSQLYFMYCALLHTPLQSRTEKDAGQTPGVRWENYCYNDVYQSPAGLAHEPAIGIKQAIEYYSHPKALEHTKNYFRYLEARYAYSTAFAAWQLMSEVDETAEYRDQEKNGQLVDRSENRAHVRNWTDSLSTFLKENPNGHASHQHCNYQRERLFKNSLGS